jgi:hypothetical protein
MSKIIEAVRGGFDQFMNYPEQFFAPAYWDSKPTMDHLTLVLRDGETYEQAEARYAEDRKRVAGMLGDLSARGIELEDILMMSPDQVIELTPEI